MADAQEWSYKVEQWDPIAVGSELSSRLSLETLLETNGAEGWELAGAISSEEGAFLIFKRPPPRRLV